MNNALYGLAQGTAIHDFINAKVERLEGYHEQLTNFVGVEQATQIVIEQLEKGIIEQ
jgi:hypothetical protein